MEFKENEKAATALIKAEKLQPDQHVQSRAHKSHTRSYYPSIGSYELVM